MNSINELRCIGLLYRIKIKKTIQSIVDERHERFFR